MTAKIEPWMLDAGRQVNEWTQKMPTGWKPTALEIAAIIGAHAPKEKAAWEAKEKALRVFILRNADHGVDDTGEYCRAGEFTRTVFEDGTAEVYPCTCGLDDLRTILNREQEKP